MEDQQYHLDTAYLHVWATSHILLNNFVLYFYNEFNLYFVVIFTMNYCRNINKL